MTAINTLTQNRLLRTAIKDMTSELGRVQEQMTTGLKAKTFADHGPGDARKVISLRNEMYQIDSYTKGINRLDMMAERAGLSLGQIGDRVNAVKQVSVKLAGNLASADEVARQAENAFAEVYANLTADVSGQFPFSGVEADSSPLVPFDELKAGVQAVIAAAVPADDPSAVAGAVTAFFADETNWYRGGAMPNAVGIASDRSVRPAVLANDPAIRDVLTGLATMAFADRAALGDAGYKQLVTAAGGTLAAGNSALNAAVGRNGSLQSELEAAQESHASVKAYVETQLTGIEEVDPYEAASKLQALKAQLEASYSITGQLSQLSLTNYLR